MGKVSKIVELNLTDEIEDLRAKGYGYIAISKELQGKGHNISFMAVARYIKGSNEVAKNVIGKRANLQEKLTERKLNIQDELYKLKDEVNQVKQEALENRDFDLVLKAMDRLQKQFELIAKLTGELQPSKNEVNVNVNNYAGLAVKVKEIVDSMDTSKNMKIT